MICTTEVAQLPFSDVGRVQLSPPQEQVRPPKFDLQSLFIWCFRGFTLKCLFSLVLPIPTSFSQAVTPAQLPHFIASSKPSSDVGLPSPTLSKRGVTPLPPQHLPIGSFFLSNILDSWRKLASRKCRDNPLIPLLPIILLLPQHHRPLLILDFEPPNSRCCLSQTIMQTSYQ